MRQLNCASGVVCTGVRCGLKGKTQINLTILDNLNPSWGCNLAVGCALT